MNTTNLRRESCPSSDIYPPCVNKAMVKLEDLKSIFLENKAIDCNENIKILESSLKLIHRLETELLNFEHKIACERKKCFHYTCRIEKLSIIRLEQLPQFVQNEHLKASANLNELEWHLNYTQSLVDKARKRHAFMLKLNSKLLNELQNIQDYKPLVDDKLASESQILDDIAKDKQETRQLLIQARQKLKDTEIKKEDAIRSAQRERLRFKNELKRANRILNELRKELENAQLFEDQTTEETKKVNEKLSIVLLQQSSLKKTLSVIQEKLDKFRAITDKLNATLTELTEEHEKVDENYRKLNEIMMERRAQQNEKQTRLQDKLNKAEDAYRKAKRRNKEAEMDTEDMSAKIVKCHELTTKCGIQMEHDAEELEDVKVDIDELLLKISETKAEHEALTQKMKSREVKIMDQEAKLIHVKELLENQISTDQTLKKSWNDRAITGSAQFEVEKKEASRKRVTLRKSFNELEELLQSDRESIQIVRLEAEESNKTVKELILNLSRLKEEIFETESSFSSEKDALNENYNTTKDTITNLERRLEYLMWRTSTMNKKLEETKFYMGAIYRGMRPIEDEIKLFNETLSELTIQKETNVREEEQLKATTARTLSRISANQKDHQEFVSNRKEILVGEKNTNQRLASMYRCLQYEYLELKKRYLDIIAGRNQKEADIRDIKQILMLRAHLSHEEINVLKLQESYHQLLYDQCKEDSFKATDLITALNKTIEKSIANVCIVSNTN